MNIGIIGASGYAGAELVRYLLMHPQVKITYLASDTFDGKPLSSAFPSFYNQDLPICEKYDLKTALQKADFFFTAQGNGQAMSLVSQLLESGKKVIDIAADFRLKNIDTFKKFYNMEHCAVDLLAEAAYGIPEFHALDIAKARLTANPGCYATASPLALAPVIVNKIINPNSIIIDAKSGVSGAGRSKPSVASLYTEVNEGFKAYAVATHRHTPEIEQELSCLYGDEVTINFTPHLVPMNRGILVTVYASLNGKYSTADLIELYKSFYSRKRFVVVLDEGMQPCTKNVSGTNFCHIGVVSDQRTGRVIITSAIDNMGKGAAGQAVQNMNIMNGLDETTGLIMPSVYP